MELLIKSIKSKLWWAIGVQHYTDYTHHIVIYRALYHCEQLQPQPLPSLQNDVLNKRLRGRRGFCGKTEKSPRLRMTRR